jgi:uncharacterized protein (DUF2164 family)
MKQVTNFYTVFGTNQKTINNVVARVGLRKEFLITESENGEQTKTETGRQMLVARTRKSNLLTSFVESFLTRLTDEVNLQAKLGFYAVSRKSDAGKIRICGSVTSDRVINFVLNNEIDLMKFESVKRAYTKKYNGVALEGSLEKFVDFIKTEFAVYYNQQTKDAIGTARAKFAKDESLTKILETNDKVSIVKKAKAAGA